jgi:hypothetical protein
VWSGYRFVRRAKERGIPLLIVNRGWTRADADATVKVSGECGAVLEGVVAELFDGAAPGANRMERQEILAGKQ